jgi:hypothetical protein
VLIYYINGLGGKSSSPSIKIYHIMSQELERAAQIPADKGSWIEPVQVYTQEYTIYLANLIHVDSRAVIKVVYGTTLACFPNKESVDRVERQIARQQEQK